jgi:hypothetical protein
MTLPAFFTVVEASERSFAMSWEECKHGHFTQQLRGDLYLNIVVNLKLATRIDADMLQGLPNAIVGRFSTLLERRYYSRLRNAPWSVGVEIASQDRTLGRAAISISTSQMPHLNLLTRSYISSWEI